MGCADFVAKTKEFARKNAWKLTNMLYLALECTVIVLQSAIKRCSNTTPLSNKIVTGVAASISLVIFLWACSRNQVVGYFWNKRKCCRRDGVDDAEAQNAAAVEENPFPENWLPNVLAIASGFIMFAATVLGFLEEMKALTQHDTTFFISLFGGLSLMVTFFMLFDHGG